MELEENAWRLTELTDENARLQGLLVAAATTATATNAAAAESPARARLRSRSALSEDEDGSGNEELQRALEEAAGLAVQLAAARAAEADLLEARAAESAARCAPLHAMFKHGTPTDLSSSGACCCQGGGGAEGQAARANAKGGGGGGCGGVGDGGSGGRACGGGGGQDRAAGGVCWSVGPQATWSSLCSIPRARVTAGNRSVLLLMQGGSSESLR